MLYIEAAKGHMHHGVSQLGEAAWERARRAKTRGLSKA